MSAKVKIFYECYDCGMKTAKIVPHNKLSLHDAKCPKCGNTARCRGCKDHNPNNLNYRLIPRWPIISDFIAVRPQEVVAARKNFLDKGVPTEFTDKGQAIIRNQRHKDKIAEAFKFTRA